MANVFITYQLPEAAQKLLEAAGHTVTMRPEESLISPDELALALGSADAVITLLTDKIDAGMAEKAGTQLKVIANYAVGYDNLDVPALQARGITVTNTPEVLTEAVAEHAIALLISVARRIVESDTFLRTGKYQGWRPMLLLGTGLTTKTLGIIGLGRIGTDVAQRAKFGLGMNIVYNDLKPNPEFEQKFGATYYAKLEDLLPRVDAISIHVPLLEATKHLINAERLSLMRPSALVINTSRGPVVDEKALVAALQNKQIGGAGLDVFEEEPKLAPGLAELQNVVITPHTASATIEARSAMAELAAKNVIAVLAGEAPITPIKPA